MLSSILLSPSKAVSFLALSRASAPYAASVKCYLIYLKFALSKAMKSKKKKNSKILCFSERNLEEKGFLC